MDFTARQWMTCLPEDAVGARRPRGDAGNRRADSSRRVRSLWSVPVWSAPPVRGTW